jgi:hypothetical protein
MAVGKGVAESIPGSSPSLRRVYVVNKEICVRTVCAHEELLRGRKASTLVLAASSTHLVTWPSSPSTVWHGICAQTHMQAGAGSPPPSSLVWGSEFPP